METGKRTAERETSRQLEAALRAREEMVQQLKSALNARETEIERLRNKVECQETLLAKRMQMVARTQKERDELRTQNAELVKKLAEISRIQSVTRAPSYFR